MRARSWLFGCSALTTVTVAMPLTAQAPAAGRAIAPPSLAPAAALLEDAVHRLTGFADGKSAAGGAVIGVVRDGVKLVHAQGRLRRGSEALVAADTIFEIGSVTKAFTGLMLAQLSLSGAVKLDDPVQKHVPESVRVPSHEGQAIQLVHLASHTSGLPRLPSNLPAGSLLNPYAGYSVPELWEFVSGYELERAPGERYEYSNLGAGLLGQVLAQVRGVDFATLVRTQITEPFGMHDTVITLSEEQTTRHAAGHGPNGMPVPGWDLAALAGAGALRSTADDLLVWLAACSRPQDPAFAAALALSTMPRHRVNANLQVGLGWHLDGEGRDLIHWHNGATGGYQSCVALQRTTGTGVVLLCSRGPGGDRTDPTEVALNLLRSLPPPPELEDPGQRFQVRWAEDTAVFAAVADGVAVAPASPQPVDVTGGSIRAQTVPRSDLPVVAGRPIGLRFEGNARLRAYAIPAFGLRARLGPIPQEIWCQADEPGRYPMFVRFAGEVDDRRIGELVVRAAVK